MTLRSPTENENADLTPAWIAGIQVRKDASGDIHVNLDSSIPCWNDEIERDLLEVTNSFRWYFLQRTRKEHADD